MGLYVLYFIQIRSVLGNVERESMFNLRVANWKDLELLIT